MLYHVLLTTFIIEAITAILQLARLHSAVRTFWYDWSTLHEHGSSNSAHVESFLASWSPTEESSVIWIHHHVGMSFVPGKSAVFANAYAVAVESHGNTAIGISGMNEVTWHVEIILHEFCHGVVGLLVG